MSEGMVDDVRRFYTPSDLVKMGYGSRATVYRDIEDGSVPSMKVGKGRVLACEVMIVTSAIRNLIREGKTAQMASSLLSSGNEGSITMDNCLIDMVGKGIITPETAFDNCADKDYMQRKMGFGGGPGGRMR